MNSLSKYIGGHGNALGGAVTDTGLYDWSGYGNIYEAYRKAGHRLGPDADQEEGPARHGRHAGGRAGAPHRGRRRDAGAAHGQALLECAGAGAFPESHRGVAKVHYPGLESHPQHARAAALFGSRFGGLLGVELADGVDCFDFLNRLRIVLMATHLGDTRSLALPAAHTIYYEMGAERRQQMGIADSLIRVSVGIEDEGDLLFDFDQALNGCLQG